MSKVRVIMGSKTQGRGFGKDFPAIIDVKCVGQLKAGTRCNERIQVEHGSCRPQKENRRLSGLLHQAIFMM